jgi:D-sedoheptulose 7-phosphate isomerase
MENRGEDPATTVAGSIVERRLAESARTLARLAESQRDAIAAAGKLCAAAIGSGNKVLLCGNGGSAADSQHIATELVVRLTSAFDRAALAAIALTTDSSLLTACANDYGFEHIFERQVEALGKPGDVLVAITTSGKSKNCVLALRRARALGLKSVLLSAGTGGECAALADVSVLVPAQDTGHIQESHIATGHIIAEIVERTVCGRSG